MLNKEKGITLIALIITIIVMLILVGVTINVALNGGLFQKAETAKTQTQLAVDREELQMAVIAALNDYREIPNAAAIKNNLSEEWDVTGNAGGPYTCTSPKENVFEVDKKGNIKPGTIGNEPVAFNWESVGFIVDTNTEYIAENGPILNFTVDGKLKVIVDTQVILEIDATNSDNIDDIDAETRRLKSFPVTVDGINGMATISMNENKTDVDVIVTATIEGMPQNMNWSCVKQVYDNVDVYTNEEVLKMLGISNSTGTYKGTWTVLEKGTDGKPTKLVSTRDVAKYTLGYEDPKATGKDNLEKSIWSYQNAVKGEETLNKVAQEATGITSARSIKIEDIYDIIGEENINKGTDHGRVYIYYYNEKESEVYSKHSTEETGLSTGYSSLTFVNDAGATVVIDSKGDEIPLTDCYTYHNLTDGQKTELGALATSQSYWLASYCVSCASNGVMFSVYYINDYNINSSPLFHASNLPESISNGVRAVISI